MPDPLSTSSGIAGFLSLGIKLTETLVKFYSEYKDRDAYLTKITRNLGGLQNTFRALETAVQDCQSQENAHELLEEVSKTTQGCHGIIDELQGECRKFHSETAAKLADRIRAAGHRAA